MRRIILMFVCAIWLSACSGKIYDNAYIASGDGVQESELIPDTQFANVDDINIVVKLNRHDSTVTVTARIIDLNGDVWQEITGEASSKVGTVILGIDDQARSNMENTWINGRYTVEILVDEEKVDTLYFRID